MKRVALGLIRLYQMTLSPYWPARCRFSPSCSHYALEAVERLGLRKGGWLGVRRLLRCHPFGGFGYDPVPLPQQASAEGGPGSGGRRQGVMESGSGIR